MAMHQWKEKNKTNTNVRCWNGKQKNKDAQMKELAGRDKSVFSEAK